VRLAFRFTDRSGTESFASRVPSLSVFVFDGQGLYVERYDDMDNSRFSPAYTMNLPLTPGTYSFVVWGGITSDDYYLNCDPGGQPVTGVSHINDVKVRLAGNHSQEITSIPADKFHGMALDTKIVAGEQNVVPIELTKNTNEIRLTILGLPVPAAPMGERSTRANPCPQMNLWMTAANAGYDFHNSMDCLSPPITYHAQNIDGDPSGAMVASLHTLRLQLNDNTGDKMTYQYTLWNSETASVFHSADLLHDIIAKTSGGHYNTQAKIDSEDLFRITIDLAAHAGVTVTVNDYKVNTTENEIQ
jgi:hypothetical protein